MLRNDNMAILIRCVVLRYFIDGHYRKMRVLRQGGLANLRLMRSRPILALAISLSIILDLSSSLSSKLVTSGLKDEIAVQTNFKNLYIQEKAKTSSATLESVKCRQQVESLREELSNVNARLVSDLSHHLDLSPSPDLSHHHHLVVNIKSIAAQTGVQLESSLDSLRAKAVS